MAKDAQYRIRIEHEELEIWRGAARALKMPLSHLIRLAVNEYLSHLIKGVYEK